MPRKKTIQPMPIEIHQADGMTIEVYRDDDRPIGRGLGNRNQSEDRTSRAISWLADLHLSKRPHDHRLLDSYLKNPSDLARWLEQKEKKGQSRAFWRSAKQAVDIFKALQPCMKERRQA